MVYQIDDTTAVASQPALPTDSIGTPGFFTGGSTSGGAPTRVRYWWLNMVQQELLNIALAAGLTADKTDNTQCITAIKALAKQAASGAVLGSPGVLATGDVAGSVLYYSAALGAPAFTYGTTTVGLLTTTALDGYVTTAALTTALGNYLSLGGGNVTGDMDWGDKTKASTVTHRFWSAGPPATGDATPDVTVTVTGGTPGTANQGTYDLTGAGRLLVPDPEDFTGKSAMNAETAEGRYAQLSMLPLRNLVAFEESATWVVPPGVTRVRYRVMGGGGAGGNDSYGGGSGGGGGGGGYCEGIADVSPGDEIVVTVGAGGPSPATLVSSNGASGGTSSFGTFGSATGGVGGTSTVSSANTGSGSIGGIGTGGQINASGGSGFIGGQGSLAFNGSGGSSLWGGGGTELPGGGTAGMAGMGYGGGGAGGAYHHVGGAGAPGLVVVEY